MLALDRAASKLARMAIVLLNVEGIPRPQPRPRLARGRVVSTLDANAKRWQASILKAARLAADAHGAFQGAVAIQLSFGFPTRHKDRHGQPHLFRPDADNLAKLALDQIMKAGLFKDDSAVSLLVVRKSWDDKGWMIATLAEDQRQARAEPTPEPCDPPRWVN